MIVISISGIAVSNHLTPNDVQILFADLHYGDLQYVVTGQKHKGVIGIDLFSLNIRIFDYSGLVEKMVSRLCRALWFERGDTKERIGFLTDVINMARVGKTGSIAMKSGFVYTKFNLFNENQLLFGI